MTDFIPTAPAQIAEFIARWSYADGGERANYQLFLTELCQLLKLPQPDPAGASTEQNAYVFERRVDIHNPDGSSNRGFIDLYKRGCFVLEAKQTGKQLDSQVWDKAMLRAQNQADQYVRSLPADEGRPPFIVVTDVGRSLELYAEFSQSGGSYVPFPDPGHYRIRLVDLNDESIQRRLHHLWHDPQKLDPSKLSAQVTRRISAKLAELARSLEQQGYDVERVAHFLKRCLFTMFSEDVELLPHGSFTQLLQQQQRNPQHFALALSSLWESMRVGGYSPLLNHRIREFNGGMFADIEPIPLDADQIQMLIDASKADWRFVEPAIFGTLLERALDPRERHKLGAHFTPRAYVERLVMPTLIEPLREQWRTVQVVAETWLQKGKPDKAVEELRQFHYQLCQTRVLDPACGSGNFLYVALEHMKRLEGEVLNLISELSAGQGSFSTEGLTVDPHQFLGLELNPRAAAIAEIVLWIGYLQWHFRIYGALNIPDPVLRNFQNIQHRDALITYERKDLVTDESGRPVTLWDGISFKPSPTTGELIPDETQRIPVYDYVNPAKAEWPEAEYIVGNPPFIGAATMRRALGDGYVDAVRKVYKGEVPDSADFVMYWWHIAANKARLGQAKQFGFITTNSLRQTFNRRVLEPHLNDPKQSLSLLFAIPDHPWVDSNDGAAVRIAMTVGGAGERVGVLRQIVSECAGNEESREVILSTRSGRLFADLVIGADLAGTGALLSNSGLGFRGVTLMGSGFWVTAKDSVSQIESDVLRPLRNGKDLTDRPRGVFAIDFYGMSESGARSAYPAAFQRVLDGVKPERDQSKRKSYRDKWWIFAEPRPELRAACIGLSGYIVTPMTAKHRIFTFVESEILPDQGLIALMVEKPYVLGLLSTRLHVIWALATGGRLGVGNDSRYNNTRCFETFPFPDLSDAQHQQIAQLAEQLDTHRKRQQAEHETLTLTGMYNVLEKLRSGEALTAKEKVIHQQGLVSVLKELHDELDNAVFDAYGWSDLGEKLVGKPGATTPLPDKPAEQAEAEEELLIRLVALNAERAAEEARGHVRWLRPDYQAPDSEQTSSKLDLDDDATETAEVATTSQNWPKSMPEQVTVIRDLLATAPRSLEALAAQFKRKPVKSIEPVLAAMQVLGHARLSDGQWRLV